MRVVVIGSGLAGITVAEALAKERAVTVVTAETHGYYSRPRLSHGFSTSASPVLKPFADYVLAGVTAEQIDRARQEVMLADGRCLPYDRLVLATGSAARIPPVLAPFRPQFLTLNSLDDLLTLRRRREKHGRRARWAIIGGGLIGCEVASDLNKAGDEVTIFHREDRLLELQFTPEQSQALDEHFAALGVVVRYNQDIREIFPRTMYDGVIVSTGFAPRVDLARDAGLATGRGIQVNADLRTADEAIYAVGDVAEVEGKLYPFVSPIRSQALWLASHLLGQTGGPWSPPAFSPIVKVHGFKIGVGRIPTAVNN